MYFSNFLELAEGRKEDLRNMFDRGHTDIKGSIPDDPQYTERRNSAIKNIMKGMKKNEKSQKKLRKLKEAPSDWLNSEHAKEQRAANLKKEKSEKKNPKPNDSRKGHVGYNLSGAPYSKNAKDPFVIDDKAPKNKEYRF